MYNVSKLSLAVAAITASASFSSFAEDFMLEEIVVTAQKRAQSLQDVPMSVSAVSGEKMAEAGIANLSDMAAYIPNFQKSDTSIGQYLVVRGIGSGINQGFEQSVVQYMDDIALGRGPLARMPFMDLERVEVLRGPQNVLFGKNSIAGALSSSTAKPTEEFEANIGVEYQPKDDAKTITAVISGALTDSVRARLAVRDKDSEGFHENNLTGEDDGGTEERAVRLTLGFDINDDIDATLKLERDTFDFNGRSDEMMASFKNANGLTYAEDIALIDAGLQGVGPYAAALNPGGPADPADIWPGGLPSGGSDDGLANYRRNTNFEERSENVVDNVTFTLNWDLGGITMTSVTGYVAYEQEDHTDTDGSGFHVLESISEEKYDQFSQEIRFVSPGGETIDWIAGAYYQDWDLEYNAQNPWGPDSDIGALGYSAAYLGRGAALGGLAGLTAGSGYTADRQFKGDSKTMAVFAQATWNASEELRLTFGGRYTYEKKTAQKVLDIYNTATGTLDLVTPGSSFCGLTVNADTCALLAGSGALNADLNSDPTTSHDLDEERTERSFTPTLMAEWDYSADTMIYFTASKGFKAGGFDARSNKGDTDNFEFEDENVLSGELGAKMSLADGAAELNVALFYSAFDDMQVSVFDGSVGFNVGNAGKAVSQGIELDGRWRVSEGLTLSGSMGYLDFEFKEFDGAQCNASTTIATGASACDLKGEENIFTPSLAASLSADYVYLLTDGLTLRSTLDLNYTGEQHVEPTMEPLVEEDAVTKVNLRVALEADQWTFALLGKNLTDEDTYSYITATPLSNTISGAQSYTGYQDAPRTVAVQANYRF